MSYFYMRESEDETRYMRDLNCIHQKTKISKDHYNVVYKIIKLKIVRILLVNKECSCLQQWWSEKN